SGDTERHRHLPPQRLHRRLRCRSRGRPLPVHGNRSTVRPVIFQSGNGEWRAKMRRRQAFTLVELLVAMALILFMMAILSQAFVAATRSFREIKAAGDLAEKLRAVSIQLRRELAADHFEGKKRLSQPTFWDSGPPRQGFFRIYQGSRPRPGGLC